jgi:hypothetical protein
MQKSGGLEPTGRFGLGCLLSQAPGDYRRLPDELLRLHGSDPGTARLFCLVERATVLRAGNRVRVTVQLIQGETGRYLWADSYERDATDVLALQNEVAQAVASQIFRAVSPGNPSRAILPEQANPAAYDAYLRGRYFWNKRSTVNLEKAIGYFNQAQLKRILVTLLAMRVWPTLTYCSGSLSRVRRRRSFRAPAPLRNKRSNWTAGSPRHMPRLARSTVTSRSGPRPTLNSAALSSWTLATPPHVSGTPNCCSGASAR